MTVHFSERVMLPLFFQYKTLKTDDEIVKICSDNLDKCILLLINEQRVEYLVIINGIFWTIFKIYFFIFKMRCLDDV